MGAMINRGWWAKERKLGVSALAAVILGWALLLYIQTFTSVCATSAPLFWVLILISLASPVAIVWASVKDKWWWAIGIIPAIFLLFTVLETFEGC